jgi:hypothetical protein
MAKGSRDSNVAIVWEEDTVNEYKTTNTRGVACGGTVDKL